MNQRLCPRCRTPVAPDGKVCERCEQPLDGPAAVRYNPAGLALPSPIQGHATVLVGILAAIALLVVGAWFAHHDVGPFRAEVVGRSVETGGQAMVVDLRIHNDGNRAGKARCRMSGVAPDGSLRNSTVELSPSIPGGGDVRFQLRATDFGDAHDVTASCS